MSSATDVPPGETAKTNEKNSKIAGNVGFKESEIRELRIGKISEIRNLGFNPYGYSFDRTHTTESIDKDFG